MSENETIETIEPMETGEEMWEKEETEPDLLDLALELKHMTNDLMMSMNSPEDDEEGDYTMEEKRKILANLDRMRVSLNRMKTSG